MRCMTYILDHSGEPVECHDTLEWGEWFECASNRKLAKDTVDLGFGLSADVSTVFLGIDHGFEGGEPILWETMIFGLPDGHKLSDYQRRWTSRGAALCGHDAAIHYLHRDYWLRLWMWSLLKPVAALWKRLTK